LYALVTRRKAPSGGVGAGGGGPLQPVEIKIHLMLREFPLKQTQNTSTYICLPFVRVFLRNNVTMVFLNPFMFLCCSVC